MTASPFNHFLVPTAPLCLCASALLIAGCNRSGDFPVAKTTGKVICEGQPVPYVTVFFEPLQTGKSALVGKQGVAFAEKDGTFSISTYGDNDGAVVGKHRVRVGPPRGGPPPGFSCPCVLDSEVDVTEVNVKKGQTNNFDLVLKKKTGKERTPLHD
jgi:hypothetical protein